MIYLLTWRNYLEKLDVHIFDTPAIASTWDALHGDAATSSKIISEPMDIDFAKKFMIDLYNALGKPEDEKLGPNGFNNRTTGQDKIFDRLSQHFKNLPVTPAAEQPAAEPIKGEAATTQEIIDMATKAKKAKKAQTKKVHKPFNETKPGKGKPVRESSSLGVILTLMLEGTNTLDQIVKKSKVEAGKVNARDKVLHRMKQVLRKDHGVDFTINKDGIVKASLPEGFTKASIFKTKA